MIAIYTLLGGGLSAKQREICDGFVFIPQYSNNSGGTGGMASINVACASAIVLYSYALWGNFKESLIIGEKFVE